MEVYKETIRLKGFGATVSVADGSGGDREGKTGEAETNSTRKEKGGEKTSIKKRKSEKIVIYKRDFLDGGDIKKKRGGRSEKGGCARGSRF